MISGSCNHVASCVYAWEWSPSSTAPRPTLVRMLVASSGGLTSPIPGGKHVGVFWASYAVYSLVLLCFSYSGTSSIDNTMMNPSLTKTTCGTAPKTSSIGRPFGQFLIKNGAASTMVVAALPPHPQQQVQLSIVMQPSTTGGLLGPVRRRHGAATS